MKMSRNIDPETADFSDETKCPILRRKNTIS